MFIWETDVKTLDIVAAGCHINYWYYKHTQSLTTTIENNNSHDVHEASKLEIQLLPAFSINCI